MSQAHQIDVLLSRIAALQSKGNSFFPAGLFPSFRVNPNWLGYRRPDTNIFFTSITLFTLQQIKPFVSESARNQIDSIAEKATLNYPNFRNKDGLQTYNFYQTQPSQHFPHGYLFHRFDHFRLPDDADDTVMIYLLQSHTPEEAEWLHQKLSQHANHSKQVIRNTFPAYQHLKAYSTWFGKKMYLEFDACVLSNVLYFVYQYQLPLNQHDSDSLAYIKDVILSDRYRSHPFQVAHQYPRTPLIIYHVSRLMAAFEVAELELCRKKLIEDTLALLKGALHQLDRMLLSTSLRRLGIVPDAFAEGEKSNQDFYFFIGGFLTAYENPMLYRMAALPFFHVRWHCEAHEWALEAEYLCLEEKARRGGD